MKNRILLTLLALLLLCTAALAETGVAYGVYKMEGESPDSLIRATVELEGDTLKSISFDEKLLPVSLGGAEGWAQLPADATVTGAIQQGGKSFAPAFLLDGETWQVSADLTVSNADKGDFIAFITTNEGGDWYFAQESATLLDADGKEAGEVAIGTKASIEHGVHFWVSDITFPGNIKAIEDFLVANGVEFSADDIAKNDAGFWAVGDAVSGATLAGTPNYLLLAQDACRNALGK